MGLKFYYKRLVPADSGYLFLSEAQDYQKFLTGRFEPLPFLTGVASQFFLSDYNHEIQQSLNLNRGHKLLRMTPFAMRNTWQSSFYQGAESYARLSLLSDGEVHFHSPEWFLWACKHMKAQADHRDIRRAQIDLYKLPLYRLFMAYQGLRFSLTRKVSRRILPKNLQLILTSIWTAGGQRSWAEQGREPFYGDLPQQLGRQGKNIAIIYHAEGWHAPAGHEQSVPALNFTALLKLSDWVCLAGQLFFFRMKFATPVKFPCSAIYRDVSQSLSNQLPLALISRKAIQNLIEMSPQTDVFSLYENNCWEQGVLRAAKETGRKVTAYQHTAHAPSLLKMDNHIHSKMLPDKIVASGPESARILTEVMGYGADLVEIGGSLRHHFSAMPDLYNPHGKVLVLLQGSPDDALLLHVLRQHLDPQDVIVRCHPSWPVKSSFFTNISQQDMQGDLAQSCVALYTGTTAAFEALSAGVPAVQVNLGGPLSTDPLFALKDCAIKITWNLGDDLKALLAHISALSEPERRAAREMALRYIQDYFSPAHDSSVKQVAHG